MKKRTNVPITKIIEMGAKKRTHNPVQRYLLEFKESYDDAWLVDEPELIYQNSTKLTKALRNCLSNYKTIFGGMIGVLHYQDEVYVYKHSAIEQLSKKR